MKQYTYNVIVCLCMILVGCDHISEQERLIYEKPEPAQRVVLLEDFTGQRCINCPKATDVIEQLLETYGDALVAVGIHGGPLSFAGNAKVTGLATKTGDEAEAEFGDKVFTWNQYDAIKAEQGEAAANAAQDAALAAGKILVKDSIADIFLQQILTRPNEFDVVATMNLNGDYISDALAAQVGGIGIAPGANINYLTGHAIFEATHGTAPKYAGQDKVNPSSVLLSGVLMLEHLGWQEAADLITASVEKTISSKYVTYDFARLMDGATEVKCSEFATRLIENF